MHITARYTAYHAEVVDGEVFRRLDEHARVAIVAARLAAPTEDTRVRIRYTTTHGISSIQSKCHIPNHAR